MRTACSQQSVISLHIAATLLGNNFSLLTVPLVSSQTLSQVTSLSEMQPTRSGVLIPLAYVEMLNSIVPRTPSVLFGSDIQTQVLAVVQDQVKGIL